MKADQNFDFNVYRLRIYPITPVHIYGGKDIDRFEYILLGKTFRRIDLSIFFSEIKDLSVIKNFLALDFSDYELVTKKLNEIALANSEALKKATLWVSGVSPGAIEFLSGGESTALKPVKGFVRVGYDFKACVPGSSVKGAINTAIMYKLYKEKKIDNKDLQNATLGGSPNDSLGRLIRISDTLFGADSSNKLKTYVLKAERVKKEIKNQENGSIPTLVESWYGQDNYSEHILELVDAPKKAGIQTFGLRVTPEEISQICNDYYQVILKNEDQKIREKILSSLSDVSKNSNKTFILRLGWGSGQETFTLNKRHPKTRWLAERTEPFGWCVCEIAES